MNYSGNTRTVLNYGMTPLQRGMLVNVMSAPDSGVETTQVVVTDPDPLDLDRLQAAWKKAIERYDMLRTRFEWDGQGEPVQVVEPEVSLWLGVGDWTSVPEDEREARLEAYLEADRYTSVDVFAAPMYRLKALDLGADGFYLIWTFHHSALDGRAYSKVIGEVFSAYDAMGDGTEFTPGPAPAFRSYVDWLRTRDTSAADTYWRNLLTGFERPTPIDLPWPVMLPEGKRRNCAQAIKLPVEVLDRLNAFAAKHEVNLNTLVQAAWALLLHHLSGDRDIVFGATRASRSSGPAGAADIVGLVINTPPMRIAIDPDQNVGDWLQGIRSQHLAHRPHEHVAMQDLQRVAQVPPGAPVFDTIVVFDSLFLGQRLQRLSEKWARRRVRRCVMPSNPLRLDGYVDGELLLEIQYFRDRFDDESIARMCARLKRILYSFAEDDPAQLRDIAVLPDEERRRQIEHWNATEQDVGQAACVHELFKARMRERPDAIAVVAGEHRLTYGALEVRSNRLANHLVRQGVKPGDLVGLCVTRSVDMVVAVLGILKAGAGYVPMDPAYPLERLRHMMDTANCSVLLGEDGLVEHALDRNVPMVLLERDGEDIAKESEMAPTVEVAPDSLAYVIFTSGSTGRPKGVQVPHSAVVNFLCAMKQTPGLGRDDVLLAVTTLSFDIHVLELLGPLAAGGTVVLANREEAIDGERLTALIAEHGVNVMQATPTTWRLLIEAGWQGGDGFRPLVGGEALPRDLLRSLLARVPKIWNMYGPTETTVWSTCCELSDPEAPILIGRPVGNTRVYVLDDNMTPVPVGMPGELYIGGAGVTRGYLGQPELTEERFVPDPFKAGGGRLYRTGDLVRYHPYGDLEFLNRLDSQVKIRGYRIELGKSKAF